MTTAGPDVLRAVAAVAQAASAPRGTRERAETVLAALRGVVPFECAELSAYDPVAEQHTTVGCLDYDTSVLVRLGARSFIDELDDLGMRTSGTPMRIRDLPRDALAGRTVNEVLLPAGFRDGLTMCLTLADGRHAGLLNLSTAHRAHPSDAARETIALLGRTLANVVDPARTLRMLASMLEPGSCAVALCDGVATELEGFSAGPVLSGEHPALGTARAFARCGRAQRFLAVAADERSWWAVQPLHSQLDDAWVISARPTIPPYGLTRREVEVLTLLTRGRSNPEIAATLVVSPRTIATHVEHILDKLGVPARAAAAARAVGEGLLLPLA